MFNQYVIVDASLRNVERGYAFELRIPYYRGLGLSMVELAVSVDDVPIPAESARFAVHGNEYSLADLENQTEDRWGFHEAATVTVLGEPLPAGPHQLSVVVTLRVSYIPTPSVTSASKTLTVG